MNIRQVDEQRLYRAIRFFHEHYGERCEFTEYALEVFHGGGSGTYSCSSPDGRAVITLTETLPSSVANPYVLSKWGMLFIREENTVLQVKNRRGKMWYLYITDTRRTSRADVLRSVMIMVASIGLGYALVSSSMRRRGQ